MERTESQNAALNLINVFAVVSVISLFLKLPSGELSQWRTNMC